MLPKHKDGRFSMAWQFLISERADLYFYDFGGHQTEMHGWYVRVRAKTGLSERPCRVLPRTVVEADSLGTQSRRWRSILLWKNVIV